MTRSGPARGPSPTSPIGPRRKSTPYRERCVACVNGAKPRTSSGRTASPAGVFHYGWLSDWDACPPCPDNLPDSGHGHHPPSGGVLLSASSPTRQGREGLMTPCEAIVDAVATLEGAPQRVRVDYGRSICAVSVRRRPTRRGPGGRDDHASPDPTSEPRATSLAVCTGLGLTDGRPRTRTERPQHAPPDERAEPRRGVVDVVGRLAAWRAPGPARGVAWQITRCMVCLADRLARRPLRTRRRANPADRRDPLRSGGPGRVRPSR